MKTENTKWGRLFTAMVTPFNDRGKVDYKQAQKLAIAVIESGSDGLVVSGTTGESPTLTKEEKLRLFEEVKQAIGARGTVIANTGNYSTAESIELTKEASNAGSDGIMMVVPYYNKPTQEGLYQHFKAIAESTDKPCILYNVPSRTVINLLPETVVRLSKTSNIVGIKEASGNLEQIAQLVRELPPNFFIYSGNDGDTFSIMCLGGYGVISVASHLVGRQMRRMIEGVTSNRRDDAATIHLGLQPLFKALSIVTNPIPVKYALNCVGFNVGKPRLPLVEPDEKSATQIRSVLKEYTIDLIRK